MKTTPLHSQHKALGARMGAFGGWDMPIQYKGILQEHAHTRNRVSVFDICHMGEFEVQGPSAEGDLERLLTPQIAGMAVGQCRYGYLLNETGGVLDDLTCYRLGEARWFLVVNAGTAQTDAAWIQSQLSADTAFIDHSDKMAKLDVQGPESRSALEAVFAEKLPELGYFRAVETSLMGVEVILSRTGYTGEWGYEIYLPETAVECFWTALLQHEAIEPAGLGARDTLRLEMGYPLYGHELNEQRSPAGVSRGAFIALKKDFIGKARVEADLAEPKQFLVGLKLPSKRAARAHDGVFAGDEKVGEVTSGSLAPSLHCAVALAFVVLESAAEGTALEVEIRGKRQSATVVPLPFYTGGTARGLT